MTPSWWRQESPIGTLTVLATDRGVQQIEFGPTAFDAEAVEGAVDADLGGRDSAQLGKIILHPVDQLFFDGVA